MKYSREARFTKPLPSRLCGTRSPAQSSRSRRPPLLIARVGVRSHTQRHDVRSALEGDLRLSRVDGLRLVNPAHFDVPRYEDLRDELNEFVELLPAMQHLHTGWYAGTADAIYQNLDIINGLGINTATSTC